MSTTIVTDTPVLEELALVEPDRPLEGIVYTDTVIFSAPEAFLKDVPYQVAIVDLADGSRLTVRIEGDNVVIGDRVVLSEYRAGVPFFKKPL